MRTSLGIWAAFGPAVTRFVPSDEARATFVDAAIRAE